MKEWLVIGLIIAIAIALPFILKRKNSLSAGNAIAEADVYIAYGQKDQAIKTLETALSSNPRNTSLKSKLATLKK